ncbi:hypothetical protein CVT26_016116 [Gymnopilus dilepis]|uniref:Uncharacterized protein n=1 Tax=Gymnopilus dilepis TaxID=231916 RepID=A0A409XYU3_9AGAR|nr:hypothetical protein CVT26_016116 [Gymnopilus dilepis]
MTYLALTLRSARHSLVTVMGQAFQRLLYPASNFYSLFLRCISSPRITFIAAILRIRSFRLGLWQSCSSILGRTISIPILNIFSQLRSAVHYIANHVYRRPRYTYMTPEMEEKYWKRATVGRRRLQRSDARYVGNMGKKLLKDREEELPPLVMSYTPALPPERRKKAKKLRGYYISAKDYCKWHRMVFPGDDHPTLAEASRLRKMHDAEELKVIHRISRMLPDDEVFPRPNTQPRPWSPKYQRKWRRWRKFHRDELERQ